MDCFLIFSEVIELLHEAAYGDTLGQSLYCPVNSTSQYGPKQVKDYMAKHYAASNIGIVGMGCDHFLVTGEAEELAGLVGSNTAPAAPKPVHYRGGELYMDKWAVIWKGYVH